jgi:hypothetical protein
MSTRAIVDWLLSDRGPNDTPAATFLRDQHVAPDKAQQIILRAAMARQQLERAIEAAVPAGDLAAMNVSNRINALLLAGWDYESATQRAQDIGNRAREAALLVRANGRGR